jgi:dihydroxyacetone kinase
MKGKPFKDTKLGSWLKEKAPNILDTVGDVLPDKGVLGIIKNLIDKDPNIAPEDKLEFEKILLEHEREMYALEVEDRNSARSREVEITKAGGNDHLMYAAGYTALGTFMVMVYAVVWRPSTEHSALFHQLMGIIEGVALTVFGYYFGTSKRAEEKLSKKG